MRSQKGKELYHHGLRLFKDPTNGKDLIIGSWLKFTNAFIKKEKTGDLLTAVPHF